MTIKILAAALLLNGLLWIAPASAQSGAPQSAVPHKVSSPQPKPTTSKPAAPKSSASPAKKAPAKPLIYLNDARSSKSSSASANQKSELVNEFEQNCSSVELTDDKAKASYQMTVERDAVGKGFKTAFGLTNTVHKMNLVTVTSKSGNLIFSESGHSTTPLVDQACTAITNKTPGANIAEK